MTSQTWKPFLLLAAAMLLCSSVSGQETDEVDEASKADSVPASTMKIKLRGDMELSGTPMDVEFITVNSLFGQAKLPIHTVAGFDLHRRPTSKQRSFCKTAT